MAKQISRRQARKPGQSRPLPGRVAGSSDDQNTLPGLQLIELDPREIVWQEHRIGSQYDDSSALALRQSLAQDGQQDPIIVYKVEDTWMGAGGMHRCVAAIENGAPTIIAIVRQGSEMDVVKANYITGLHQQRADPLSVAETLWYDYNTRGIDLDMLAAWSGRTPEYLERMMRIALADAGVKQALGDGIIMQGHAELIAQLEDHAEQREWLHRLLAERITVKELADLIAGRDQQTTETQSPVRGTRRSTKPQACSICHSEIEGPGIQTLQVCDGCFAIQQADRSLAAWIRSNDLQLREAEQALAESPQFVWLAEGIEHLLAMLDQPSPLQSSSKEEKYA